MEENNTIDSIDNGKKNGNQTQIAGAIILAGMLVAGAVLLKGSSGNTPPLDQRTDRDVANIDMRPVSADEHILGNLDAEITIVEYSDTECPFCKVFHNTMHNIVEQNQGKVAWVYRQYPIPGLHKKAFQEAEATECAWEQGGNNAFWQYIDQVFARTNSNDRLDPAELPKIAGDVGLDVSLFSVCLESGKFKNKIESDMEDGTKAGATGTPYSVIVSKKDISAKQKTQILSSLPKPEYVSFDSKRKNLMSLNGALPIEMINGILDVLLK